MQFLTLSTIIIFIPLNSDKKAFSLAEVLITLAVIGVVASMTIPALLQSANDKQFRTKFKKKYSELSQVTQLLLNDAGGSFVGYFTSEAHFGTRYTQYMKTLKYCSTNIKGNCFHQNEDVSYLNGASDATISEPNSNSYVDYRDSFILLDGTMIYTSVQSANCTFNGNLPRCGFMILDVNGFKGPNVFGRDLFGVWIKKDRIAPWGLPGGNHFENTCSTSSSGEGCAYTILQNEDY